MKKRSQNDELARFEDAADKKSIYLVDIG